MCLARTYAHLCRSRLQSHASVRRLHKPACCIAVCAVTRESSCRVIAAPPMRPRGCLLDAKEGLLHGRVALL
eukprot:5225071-Prymnesium_polylepis.1